MNWRVRLMVGAVALLLVGCGDPSADASVAALHRAFSPCPHPGANRGDALSYLAESVAWIQVASIESDPARLDVDYSPPAMVTDQVGQTFEMTAHRSYWPGVYWGLEKGGEVWAATGSPDNYEGENRVLFFVVSAPGGNAFLPGDCSARFLYEPLRGVFGDSTNQVLLDMRGKTGDELAELLGLNP